MPSFQAWVYDARRGGKVYKTFRTATEAKGWRRDAAAAVKRAPISASTRQTFRDFAEAWLEDAAAGVVLARSREPYKPSTLRGYVHDLRTFVYPAIGAAKIGDVRRVDIQNVLDRLRANGASASKVRNVAIPVQAVYRAARRKDLVIVDPTDGLDLPAPADRRERIATPTEAMRLLDALPIDDRALWATAFFAGLRRGELQALRWSDVEIRQAPYKINVRRGWDCKAGEIAPKSRKGTRTVPVSAQLRTHLVEHKLRTGRNGEDFVFGRNASAPFTPTHIAKRALTAWTAAKLTPIGMHECRHTFVSFMHAAGLSLERIGDYVGHSSAFMTDRYRHLIEGHEQEAADVLDAFLARSTGAATGAQAV